MKTLAVAVAGYLAIILLFEVMVVVLGSRQAAEEEPPEAPFIAIENSDGSDPHNVIVGAVEVDGALYVSANHWPRRWYHRLVENPEVDVTRDGERAAYRVVPVDGAERERVVSEYTLPLIVRVLTGFPPRAFLRLDPR